MLVWVFDCLVSGWGLVCVVWNFVVWGCALVSILVFVGVVLFLFFVICVVFADFGFRGFVCAVCLT